MGSDVTSSSMMGNGQMSVSLRGSDVTSSSMMGNGQMSVSLIGSDVTSSSRVKRTVSQRLSHGLQLAVKHSSLPSSHA